MTNQIDDFKRHLQLGETAEAAALRGHELMKKGDEEGARAALKEAEDAMAERAAIEARRRIQYPPG
jgi:predicted negative regulator of RcsB-dependent stress response